MLVFCLFGLTFEFALAADLINLFTLHVYYLYRAIMRFYKEVKHFVRVLYKVSNGKYLDKNNNKWEDGSFTWD
jgi:hypothetical protein